MAEILANILLPRIFQPPQPLKMSFLMKSSMIRATKQAIPRPHSNFYSNYKTRFSSYTD
ncbi:hypothetical protein SESBI_48764 [Sesbania bispinosa]|nr:hypothetical protein SESBI_48764 [Sesbania bispinosa]